MDAARPDEPFDVRLLAGPDEDEEPSPEQLAALEGLEARTGSRLEADFNPLNGTPRVLFARDALLSDPSGSSPTAIAERFLIENSELLAVGTEFVSSLVRSKSYTNEASGVTHVEYEQRYMGLSVFQSTLRVAITDDGQVLRLVGDYYPEASLSSVVPTLSEAIAMDMAFDHVGPPLGAQSAGPSTSPSDIDLSAIYEPEAELVVFPLPNRSTTLAWRVTVPQFVSFWEVVVDADDGAILYSANLTKDAGPEGQVFEEHPDAGAQITVPFVGILPAPRDAWVGASALVTCTICTSGNNVIAISDRDGDGGGPFAGDAATHFNFGFANSWALTGNPNADELSSITSLFYFVNLAHDLFYGLGFTEAAGNFQSDNFGAGGVGGDPVVATTYTGYDSCPSLPDFNCRNNAFFVTTPDGSIPLLASFLFTDPPLGQRDPSFDGDLMMHEYGHGVSTRLVGDGALNGTQSGAMGEGWSDYFAISYYDDPVWSEYSSQNAATGLRRYAYDNSPLTYGDMCTGAFGCEVHDDGEIWATVLWDLRQFYVGQLGLSAGRVAADELVVEGLMLTPPSPSMLDARDAILQADQATGGANQASIWAVFAARGMGCSAVSLRDTSGVTEAFDAPSGNLCIGTICGSPVSPLAIPDANLTGVSDTIALADSGTITDLNVCLWIAHTWVGDLEVTLTHADSGTSVVLVDRPGVPASLFGCSGDDILSILTDEAASGIENECALTVPTILGSFRPNELLSSFDGEGLAGNWTLRVVDSESAFSGFLLGWSLMPTVSTTTPTPTASPTPTPTASPTPTPSDADGDGVPDSIDNCPHWPNPGHALPPWSVPVGDSDCDGYAATTLVGTRASEESLGTDPEDKCADTPTLFDERGPDFGEPLSPWPPDINDDGQTTFGDVLAFAGPYWNTNAGDADYWPRFDLNGDGSITFGDILSMVPFFNLFCDA